MMGFQAAPGQWKQLERSQVFNGSFQACVLELRSRVEALETNAKPTPNDRQIRSSLVERVAIAISRCEDSTAWDDEALNWAPEARAAIREVAAWLREQHDGDLVAATVLEREIELTSEND